MEKKPLWWAMTDICVVLFYFVIGPTGPIFLYKCKFANIY